MNYGLTHKLMALPLSTSERAVTSSIAYHVQQDGNSSFPSYDTIRRESGAANKTISKVIRTLGYAGILERKHRGDTLTGKDSNEYFFIFEGIRFVRNTKLSKADYAALEAKLKVLRKKVTAEMGKEAKARRSNTSIPSQMLPTDTVTNVTKQNVQTVNNDVRAVTGSEGCSIPSQMLPIPSQMLPINSNSDVPPITDSSYQAEVEPNKSQKRFTKKEYISSPHKNPENQSTDEWLEDFNTYASIRG